MENVSSDHVIMTCEFILTNLQPKKNEITIIDKKKSY